MQMEVYYSKLTGLALVTSPDGVILTTLDEGGKPNEPQLVYDDSLETVMYEYSRLGIEDWDHVDTVTINESTND